METVLPLGPFFGNTMAPCVIIGERAAEVPRAEHGLEASSVSNCSSSAEVAVIKFQTILRITRWKEKHNGFKIRHRRFPARPTTEQRRRQGCSRSCHRYGLSGVADAEEVTETVLDSGAAPA
jgi:hypothetical protein